MHLHYAQLELVSGQHYSVRTTLAELMAWLSRHQFVQCHRSWVINLRHIEEIYTNTDVIRLTGDIKASLGRKYRLQVLEHIAIMS